MANSPEFHVERAAAQLERGNAPGAIEGLRAALSLDPDHAMAHALLALCLVQQKRLHAAAHEAEIAAGLEPGLYFVHRVRGYVALARQDLKRAEAAFHEALELESDDDASFVGLARVCLIRHDLKGAHRWIAEALQIDPEDMDAKVLEGHIDLQAGELGRARLGAAEALRANPEHSDALVLMGEVLLLDGDLEGARDHAVAALMANAEADGAVELLGRVKSRRNPLMKLWWVYAAWMQRRGQSAQILILLCAFIVYRAASIALVQNSLDTWVTPLNLAWLGLVVYSFVGPVMLRRMIETECAKVELDRSF